MTSITPVNGISAAQHGRRATQGASSVAHARRGNATIETRFMPAPRKSTKDMSVRERFSTLESRFLPSKAKGVNVRFQFKITGKGGGSWYVEIKDGKCSVKEGTGPNPTATMGADAEDYLKIANGEMNKMWAFLRGKLKVSGDKDELKKFDEYFSGNSAKD